MYYYPEKYNNIVIQEAILQFAKVTEEFHDIVITDFNKENPAHLTLLSVYNNFKGFSFNRSTLYVKVPFLSYLFHSTFYERKQLARASKKIMKLTHGEISFDVIAATIVANMSKNIKEVGSFPSTVVEDTYFRYYKP